MISETPQPPDTRSDRISKGVLLDFNILTDEQMAELQNRLEKSKGRMVVFVHPYYPEEESLWTDIGGANPKDMEKMQNALPKFISVQKEGAPPIMIFHDADKIQELNSVLGSLFPENIYVLPTFPHDPQPQQGTWDELLNKLQNLGVQNVVIAGMNLTVSWPDEEDPRLAGCIADAAQEFSKQFKITISKYVYPNTKGDYTRFGGPTGPIE